MISTDIEEEEQGGGDPSQVCRTEWLNFGGEQTMILSWRARASVGNGLTELGYQFYKNANINWLEYR